MWKFIGGFLTGALVTVGVLVLIGMKLKSITESTESTTSGLMLFDEPKECMELIKPMSAVEQNMVKLNPAFQKDYEVKQVLKIMQVLDNGNALAIGPDFAIALLLLLGKPGTYYDDQKLSIWNKCTRRIGTYTYITNKGLEKTVPVVRIEG